MRERGRGARGARSKVWAMGANVALAAMAAGLPAAAQDDTWYEDKLRPGANFYDIVRGHQAKAAAKKSALQDDLTALLLKDPELYELEKDHRFKRWMEYVEPRVAPSGDMSLLDQGQATIAALVAPGAARPETRGEWEPLGPFASGTAGAGRLNWVEFHPKDTSAFMVGSPGGGVWFTGDAGKTWATTTDNIAILGAAWGAYHPTKPDTVYLGTGDGNHGDTKSLGVLRSIDGGKTWDKTGLTFPVTGSTQITKLVVDPANPEKLMVATSSGVHVSFDAGETFTKSTGITSKVWDLEIHPTNPQIVYASTAAFYRSTDGGRTFAPVTSTTSSHRMLIGVTKAQPNWVYVLRGSRSTTEGVSLSTDGGQTFQQKGAGSEIGCSQAWYDYAFAVNPLNPQDLAAGCLRIFRSSNGGAGFTQAGSSYHVDIQGLFFRKDGTLFTTNDGGIWRATGATTWQNLNNNLNIGQSYRMGVYRYDYDRVCTGRQDNGSDFRDGGEFKRALGGDGFECFWNNSGTRWYGETQNGGFNRCSYSNGQLSGCQGGSPQEAGTWNTPWAHDPVGASTLYAGRTSNMWKSVDNGASWSQMGTVGGSGSIRNFAVAKSNPQVIYVLKGSDVHRTTNGGQTWTNVKGNLTGTPVSVDVAAANANEVWVTVSGYTATAKVWRSTSGGSTWANETHSGLPNLPCNTLVIDNQAGGVYVGMDVGIYYKKKGMSVWENFSAGMPNASVRELEIAQKGQNVADRRILAATFGRGVWRSKLWEESVPVPVASRTPALRRFSAAAAGGVLKLRFHLGDDRAADGLATIRLTAADGSVLHEERVASFGSFARDIPLSGAGKGILMFTVEGAGGRTARRIPLY